MELVVLVELVVASHGSVDAEVLHQNAACACVLGENDVGVSECVGCSWCEVEKVSHGCGYDVEFACHVGVSFSGGKDSVLCGNKTNFKGLNLCAGGGI